MKKTLSFALALCAGMLAAGELRIDLDSMKSGVNLEIKKTSPANFIVIDSPWYKEKQKQRFELRCETFDEWKPYSFTFVPAEDGIVTMLVMSKYHKKAKPRLSPPMTSLKPKTSQSETAVLKKPSPRTAGFPAGTPRAVS